MEIEMIEFECDPMPRGRYHDYGVRIAEPKRPILQPNYAGDSPQKPIRIRSVNPPASIAGMIRRWNKKWRMCWWASLDCICGGRHDVVRQDYWMRQSERWFQKVIKLSRKHREYKIDWPTK